MLTRTFLFHFFLLLIISTAACVNTPPASLVQNISTPDRDIIHIAGDLYRFRQIRHSGVFLVTPEGIIVVDPTNPEVSAWLKQELDERFGLPVKYVIYSHSHNDHAGGGEAFAETAVFVGHENMENNLQRPAEDAPLLPREQLWDKNNDGMIQADEAGGFAANGAGPGGFERLDTNKNGSLSRAEIWAGRFGGPTVRPPDVYYKDKSTIVLGGKTVELHYTGKNHSDDMTVVYFPEERAIYTVDFLTPNRPPRTVLDGGFLPDWVDSLKQVEQLDFDIIVPGHESPGTKAHVSEQVRYLQDLYTAVAEGIAAGHSESELIEKIRMEDYSHLIEYEFSRAGNVSGAYEILKSAPVDLRRDITFQAVEPFQIFDNLYFVGIKGVASYIIKTSEGLILIDTLDGFDGFTDRLLANIRTLNFDPAEIKYVFILQSHRDHYGGAPQLRPYLDQDVIFAAGVEDWKVIEKELGDDAPNRDMILEDGGMLTLGDTTIHFEHTPGHTPGTTSIRFPVYDQGREHSAYFHGGSAVRSDNPEVIQRFINDLERIKTIPGIEVQIINHQDIHASGAADLFTRAELLKNRKAGDPHPWVAPDEFYQWLNEVIEETRKEKGML